jgi:hypothetical protein
MFIPSQINGSWTSAQNETPQVLARRKLEEEPVRLERAGLANTVSYLD